MFKKLKIIGLSLMLSVGVFGCSKTDTSIENDTMKICLVLDEGGVNDQSFNQSAWEGALASKEKYGVEVSYIERFITFYTIIFCYKFCYILYQLNVI